MKEVWKPVPGYELQYSVSDAGRVRNEKFNRLKQPSRDKDGYLIVRLSNNGNVKTHRLSRVVLTAFAGLPNFAGAEAMHLDHNKENNALPNLTWGSRLQNEQQKTASGRRPEWSKISAKTGPR
jgi:hypothetical protein